MDPSLSTPTSSSRSFSRRLSQLDAFPKTERSRQQVSSSGGFLTLVVSLFLIYLTAHESLAFLKTTTTHHFSVGGVDTGSSLQINIDIDVNMPCSTLEVHCLDASGDTLDIKLATENIKWDDKQFIAFVNTKKTLKEKSVKSLLKNRRHKILVRKPSLIGSSACRIHGSFHTSKVSGMLHVTARGYGYDTSLVPDLSSFNFTHAIHSLSFGPSFPGIDNPLDESGDMTLTRLSFSLTPNVRAHLFFLLPRHRPHALYRHNHPPLHIHLHLSIQRLLLR